MKRFLLGSVLLALAAGCGDAAKKTAAEPPAQHFQSRPDLRPPVVKVRVPATGTAPGAIFLAPKKNVAQAGPLILDDAGRVVWFHPLDTKGVADFRMQRYHGQPVLTWWRGKADKGVGDGYYVIVDRSYRPVATVRAGHGLAGDIHEFVITPRGTALFTVYRLVRLDLTQWGGPKRGRIYEGVVQERNITSGRVLFEWHSAPHVELGESYVKAPAAKDGEKAAVWDYFHINSIDEQADGTLLVSARNTRTVYKIRRSDGGVLWRLGGKHNDFTMGPGTTFAWQHDARRRPDGTITIFDNGADPKVEPHSRVLVLNIDEGAKRVTLARAYVHPKLLSSGSQGDAQTLPDGHVFVGWGANPYYTEFDRDGTVLLDARFGSGADSYRAYRFPWTGLPTDRPAATVSDGVVYASWNGATEIARWRVLAGDDEQHLKPVATAGWDGLETKIPLADKADVVVVQAVGRRGTVLGTSAPAG